jgi:twinkle protein
MSVQKRIQCPKCKDSHEDNFVLFSNGSGFCFSCGERKYSEDGGSTIPEDRSKITAELIHHGEYKDLDDRGISKKTCTLYEYKVVTFGSTIVHCENYYNRNLEHIAQKLRYPNKTFPWINYDKELLLFGAHIYLDFKKPIIITEGAIDAMSIYEHNNDLQAVSIFGGARDAYNNLKVNIEWLKKFKKVILFFDNDDVGLKATEQCKTLFDKNKVKVVDKYNNFKDANDMLCNKGDQISIILQEEVPKGMVFGTGLDIKRLYDIVEPGLDFPWPGITKMTRGLHKGQLYLLGAGSGIGKSAFLRELGYHLRIKYPDKKIANLFLEEKQVNTLLSYVSLDNNVPLGDLIDDINLLPKEKITMSFEKLLNNNNVMFTTEAYDIDSKELFKNLEYLTEEKKFDIILLDHISLIISAGGVSFNGERRDIDELMHKLRRLVDKTQCIVVAACHLSQPEKGLDWEEGREVKQGDFRGSGSLRQQPDVMIGIERNMRAEGNTMSQLRVLKNRWYSEVGKADTLYYITSTGRLII